MLQFARGILIVLALAGCTKEVGRREPVDIDPARAQCVPGPAVAVAATDVKARAEVQASEIIKLAFLDVDIKNHLHKLQESSQPVVDAEVLMYRLCVERIQGRIDQSFYQRSLEEIIRRWPMAQPPKTSPVAVKRMADFSRSICRGGHRSDELLIEDTYTFARPAAVTIYRAVAMERAQQQVAFLQKLDGSWTRAEPITLHIDDQLRWKMLPLPVNNGQATVRYHWTKAHPAGPGAVGFVSRDHHIVSVEAEIMLPPNTKLTRGTAEPPLEAGKCTWLGKTSFRCDNLDIAPREPLLMRLKIDGWENCQG